MHHRRGLLSAGPLAGVIGCSLVIGEIPPASKDTKSASSQGGSQSSQGGSTQGEGGNRHFGGSAGMGGEAGQSESTTQGGKGDAGASMGGTLGGTSQGGSWGSSGAAGAIDAGGAGAGGSPMGQGGSAHGGSGASSSGGSAGCFDECDCDDDSAVAEACAGQDCDDTNNQVYPEQTRFFAESTGSVGFDYDCDDRIEREFSKAVACSGLALVGCENESEGFLGTLPACGDPGPWGRCKVDGLACVNDVIDTTRVMRCH